MDEEQSREGEDPVQYAEVYFEYHDPSEETLQVKTEQVETSQKPGESTLPPSENMDVDVPLVRESVPHIAEQVVSTTRESVPHIAEQVISTSTPEPMSLETVPPDSDIVTVPPDQESHSSGEHAPFQSAALQGENAPFQSAAAQGENSQFQETESQYTSPHVKLFEGDDTPLNAPVKELKEKWKLLPAFLQVNFLFILSMGTSNLLYACL